MTIQSHRYQLLRSRKDHALQSSHLIVMGSLATLKAMQLHPNHAGSALKLEVCSTSRSVLTYKQHYVG